MKLLNICSVAVLCTAALALAGCGGGPPVVPPPAPGTAAAPSPPPPPPPPPPKATYEVTLYGGKGPLRSFNASNYSIQGERQLDLTLPQTNKSYTVSGTFVVEPATPPATSTGEIRYKAKLYGVNTVLRVWDVQDFNTGVGGRGSTNPQGRLEMRLPGRSSVDVFAAGTYVIERTNRFFADNGVAKYKVTLFDAEQNVINTYLAEGYTTQTGRISLRPPGGADGDIVIAGSYVVEPYVPGAPEVPGKLSDVPGKLPDAPAKLPDAPAKQ